MPGLVQPHQPRLDWQMWFAALSDVRQNRWFVGLVVRLLEGAPGVLQLLEKNPFPDRPPRYCARQSNYRYRFATEEEHKRSGAWWTRRDQREYLPTVSARGELIAIPDERNSREPAQRQAIATILLHLWPGQSFWTG